MHVKVISGKCTDHTPISKDLASENKTEAVIANIIGYYHTITICFLCKIFGNRCSRFVCYA